MFSVKYFGIPLQISSALPIITISRDESRSNSQHHFQAATAIIWQSIRPAISSGLLFQARRIRPPHPLEGTANDNALTTRRSPKQISFPSPSGPPPIQYRCYLTHFRPYRAILPNQHTSGKTSCLRTYLHLQAMPASFYTYNLETRLSQGGSANKMSGVQEPAHYQ